MLLLTAYVFLRCSQSDRLQAALHPEQYETTGIGYYGTKVREALRLSHWMGEAYTAPAYAEQTLLQSSQFLLTATVYQLGWLPFLLLVVSMTALAFWLAGKCLRQSAGRFLVLSVVMVFLCRIICSVLCNMGCMLIAAGFPMLTGNLQSMIDMGLIGLALSVFRGGSVLRDGAEKRSWHTECA